MHAIVNKMNLVTSAWREQYDILSAVPLVFSVNEQGLLYLNDVPLAITLDSDFVSAKYGVERIMFDFPNYRTLFIFMVWPEDESPKVHSVAVKQLFSDVDSDSD